MAKRGKKVIITGVTRELADEAFAVYAKADAQSSKSQQKLNSNVQKSERNMLENLLSLKTKRQKPSIHYRPMQQRTKQSCLQRRKVWRWRMA